MAQKMTGALVFDERTDRYDIRFDLASYYGGLHWHSSPLLSVSGPEKTPLAFSKSAALAGTQKRAVSCRHRPPSVLLFTCLHRPVFRCP